jgi:hypothetical protein
MTPLLYFNADLVSDLIIKQHSEQPAKLLSFRFIFKIPKFPHAYLLCDSSQAIHF